MVLNNKSCKYGPNPHDADAHSVNTQSIPLFEKFSAIFFLFVSLGEFFDVHGNWSNPVLGDRDLCEHSNKSTEQNVPSYRAGSKRNRCYG